MVALFAFQAHSQVNDTLAFSLNDVTFDTIGSYVRPVLAGCHYTDVVGAPDMPYLVKDYLLPHNAEITGINILDSAKTNLTGTYSVYPTQTPIIPDGRPAPPFVEPDTAYYNSGSRYVGDVAEILTVSSSYGYGLVKIKVFPLQYIPSSQQLVLFTSIRLRIEYQITGTDSLTGKMSTHQYQGMLDYLSKTVENFYNIENHGSVCKEIIDYDGSRPLNLFFLPGAGGDPIEYLIITNDELKPYFEPLAAWKMAKGIPALVVSTSQIELHYSGCDLAEKIFNYLKDVYNNWGKIYILLGGETEIVPSRSSTLTDGKYFLTDLYFSDVHKDLDTDYDWNWDNDNDFGEEDNYLDLFPDNFIGRAPVKNVEQTTEFIDKILNYEQNTFDDYGNVTLIGADIGNCDDLSIPTMAWMNDAFSYIPNNLTSIRIFDDHSNWDGDFPLSQENVLKALGGTNNPFDNQHVIAHVDHSGFYCIGTSENCHREKLTIAELDDILYESGNISKIMYSGGCQPNDFKRDCFSEYFINGAGPGIEDVGIGIGFIGNVGDGHNNPQQVETFFQYLYDDPMYNLGKIFNETRIARFGEEYVKNLNFLGDPELPVWTEEVDEPDMLTIQTNLDPLVIGENQLEVTVGGLGSDEAVVCIYKENEVYGVQTTETYGNNHKAIFQNCKPDTGGDLYITATAPNHLYASSTLEINDSPSQRHLYIYGFNPANISLTYGINNFRIVLKNSGNENLSGVKATLSSSSPHIQIPGFNQIQFDSILTGTTKESTEDFEIEVLESAFDQLFIPCTLNIITDQGGFQEQFFLQVLKPQLEFRGNKIIWTSENDDMFIDQGEEVVRFKVELLNKGSETVHINTAQISEPQDDNYIGEIIVGEVSFRDIAPFDTAWCTGFFEVEMVEDLGFHDNSYLVLLEITDDKNQTYLFDIQFNNDILSEDFTCVPEEYRITLNWIPPNNSIFGYNIYRLDASDVGPGDDIEDSTLYTRLNLYVNKFSTFTDYNVEPEKEYYYKVACYSNEGLPQGPFSPAFKAWTANLPLEPWPVFLPENGHRSEGSPILYNAIPGENGDNPELEIFFPIDDRYDEYCNKSALYAFNSDGTELYDIDNNTDIYAGFVNFENAGMKATPIVGEMNNDDSYGEVAFATTYGAQDPPPNNAKLLRLYSAGDANEDDKPDNIWQIQLPGQAVRTALVAARLTDTPNEDVKIIAAEMWEGEVEVRNTSNGSSYADWPTDVPRTITLDPDDKDEVITFGIPVAADLDGDLSKEIIVGCKANMTIEHNGIYVFNSDGSYYIEEDEAFYIPNNTTNLTGLDCCPVVAEIDQTANPEIIIMASYSVDDINTAKVLVLNHDGTCVSNWDENQQRHLIELTDNELANYPALTAADLDHDGIIEILVASSGKLYAWKASGDAFNQHFPILVEGLECQSMAPLVANVDSDYENEIIITSKQGGAGFIYAFNTDGTAVQGWPLNVDGIYATPAIGDVNHDGLNEIVAVYDCYANVWKTLGETGHDEWPLYRLNSFNNAVYEHPVCNYDPNNPVEISQADEYWDDYRVMESDIVVKHSRTLTIAGRVAMPDDARIIVEQGGKLNVAGGVITSACGGLWQGIEVWGYSDKSQYDPNFIPGSVELYENAVIENARSGIATVKTQGGTEVPGYTGGIILCKDALFRNNVDGIKFYPYRNFDPNQTTVELENCSYIKNCRFETNGPLAEFESYPDAFVVMSGISGILLRGNQFINSTGERFAWNQRGTGILSYNSTYRVDELCLNYSNPCNQSKPNDFGNLFYGIRAFNTIERSRAIAVMHSNFYSTKNGIFISYMNNALIALNNFYIARTATLQEPISYGLYVEYSTGYVIEENYFENKYTGGYGNIGLYISNSGKDPNEVYKNDFKNLDYGIVAYGINRDEEGAGLCLKCNNFETCTSDIHVIPENDGYGNWLQGREQGIASMQGDGGSDTAPAGNTFTELGDLPDAFNYFNHQDCNNITYYFHATNETPYKIIPEPHSPAPLVEPTIAEDTRFLSKEDACPSNIGGIGMDLTYERDNIAMENELITFYTDSIQTVKDGGDTYSLNLDVMTSMPNEAYQVRQQLLNESPYLSDTVMKSAIFKENVLPNAMVRDVLVANPQSAKSSEIIEKVNDRIDPMPEEMMDEILENLFIKGNLEILQDKLASHKTNKYHSLNRLESYYKQDTLDVQGSRDSLISLWSTETDPEILYKLAFLYLSERDSMNCFSVLNSITQLNDLSEKQEVVFEDYSTMAEILWLTEPELTIQDSAQIEQLTDINSRNTKPGCLARNVLIANHIIDYTEPIYLADELKSMPTANRPDIKKIKKNTYLSVFPNPAKDYTIVSYDLKGRQGNSSIIISTLDGKACYKQDLTGNVNQVVIPLKRFSAGPYSIQLIKNGAILETVKLVISN